MKGQPALMSLKPSPPAPHREGDVEKANIGSAGKTAIQICSGSDDIQKNRGSALRARRHGDRITDRQRRVRYAHRNDSRHCGACSKQYQRSKSWPSHMSATEKLQDHLAYPPRLLAVDRASSYVGFGSTKFLEMVDDGRMPKPVDVDGSKRWDRFELDDAVDNLKDRRRDPVMRDRDRLQERINAMEGKA